MKKAIFDPASAEQMIHRVRKITSDSPRQWGKMSAQQMLCHCTDQLRMAFGEIKVADTSNFMSRSLVKFLVLNVITIPKDKVKTLTELDQLTAGTSPTGFEEDRKTLCHYIQRMATSKDDLTPHGFFGYLTREQWQRLAWSHLDHHLRQFGG